MTMQFPHPKSRILPASIQCIAPPRNSQSKELNKVVGSLVGLAVGDALGASVEFRPHQYLVEHPVKDMQSGGTWGLNAGQWTDDTSMALCLASSLLTHRGFNSYDQMVRYKWWYKEGFLSSTGECFDIGSSTRAALEKFIQQQNTLKRQFPAAKDEDIDNLTLAQVKSVHSFSEYCGEEGQAGNGPLMRLAPVPLFYFRQPAIAVQLAGDSARLTHGDQKAIDACRYFAALIVAAVHGKSKKELLDNRFYETYQSWFGPKPLHPEVLTIARGSYKKERGYAEGIRGKNYIVNTLEAALWAFWSDKDSFENGALNAVNLGDDTDTTAAVYGQLAGAYYGAPAILQRWGRNLYANEFLICIGEWLYFEGSRSADRSTEQQQQRISQQSNQQGAPISQSNQHSSSQSFTHQVPRAAAATQDIMGYGAPSRSKPAQHTGTQAVPSKSYSDVNSNLVHQHHLNPTQKLDPSRMPAAGVPSGFNAK